MPTGSPGNIGTITSITQLQPILKGLSFNTAELANTDIFATDLVPTNTPTTFRVYVWTDTAGVFSCMRTSGVVTVTENLNEGNQLIADSAYEFNITLTDSETINFQLDAAATMTIIVVEVYA
jgi:hypothetical protein